MLLHSEVYSLHNFILSGNAREDVCNPMKTPKVWKASGKRDAQALGKRPIMR